MAALQPQPQITTYEQYEAFSKERRIEVFDGQIFDMASPSQEHQTILTELLVAIRNYLRKKGSGCRVFPAPFDVKLFNSPLTVVQPDLMIICDKDKLDDRGCNGAPDWIIEIVSPSTSRMDYGIKLFKYRSAGVREYWIINPKTHTVNLFDFEHEKMSNQYSFDDIIPVCIYDDLKINIAELLSYVM